MTNGDEPEEAGAAEPVDPAQGGISASVERAVKLTRDAATWLIGAFAAVAGILVAGSQLSDMGTLAAGSARWYAAVGGLVAALVGLLGAIGGALWILLPARSTLSDAARDSEFARWVDKHPELLPPGATSVERFSRLYISAQREYDRAFDALESAKAAERDHPEETARANRAKAERDQLEPWAKIVNDAATDRRLRRAAKRGFTAIFIGGTLAAVGIGAFAWAAHPPDDDKKKKAEEPAAEPAAAPVRVRLTLTPAGEAIVKKATGCDPAQAEAVRIGGEPSDPELLILPRPGCKTVRFTLSDAAGEAVEPG